MKNYLVLGVLATGLVCWGMNSQAEAGHRHGGGFGGYGAHCAPSYGYGYGGHHHHVVPSYGYGYSNYGYAPRVRSYYGGYGWGGQRGFSRRGFGRRGGSSFYLRSGNFAIGIR